MKIWRISQLGFRGKLLAIAAIGIFALALTAAAASAWVTSQRTRTLLLAQGLQITDSLANQSLLALLYRSEENALKPLAAILNFPDVHHAVILEGNGTPLAALGRHARITALPSPLPDLEEATLIGETEQEWLFLAPIFAAGGTLESPEETELFAPGSAPRERLGYACVTMGKETLHSLQLHIFGSNLGIALTFALGILALMNIGIKRMTRPLYELAAVMEQARSAGTHVYAQLQGPREILHMADVFNMMMSSLEERDQRLREHRAMLQAEVAIRTRELVQARDAALTASRHKSEFLTTISHELRTPLTAVIGYADLARESLELEGQAHHAADMERILFNAKRLLAMINTILDLSKVEAGRMELNIVPVRLPEVIEEAVATIQPLMKKQGNRLEVQIDGELGEVAIDREKLLQILLNLLSNAGKFTSGGTVTLAARFVAGQLTLSVTDTGLGIAPDQQSLIFEPFRQADGSTTRRFEGTGLGLAIVRRFCELLGGRIRLASALGHGSTFTVEIPLPIGAEQGTNPQQP